MRRAMIICSTTCLRDLTILFPISFVLPFCLDITKIKKLVVSLIDDIEQLTGTRDAIFSPKRNPNTRALLFNNYRFAQLNKTLNCQKCGAVNCDSCILKFNNNDPIRLLPNYAVIFILGSR